MSISVNINGNRITTRRERKMELSDLDRLKKSEKERLKRLRREQVREQSRAIAKNVLGRAKKAQQEELDRLEKEENTEMKRAKQIKLMELHRRYQDIENIGYAHKNAAAQVDPNEIKDCQEKEDQAAAKERGNEAAKKLKESTQQVKESTLQQNLKKRVRENENVRSKMVAHLGRKSCPTKVSGNDNNSKIPTLVSKKKMYPIRKPSSSKKKQNQSINVTINTKERPSKSLESTAEISKLSGILSEDDEPRKTLPTVSCCGKVPSYKPDDYQESLSSTRSSSPSSTLSEDSSYFSDNYSKSISLRKTSESKSTSSRVEFYDHNTRQRSSYNQPSGLVEKLNVKNKPSAHEKASQIVDQETREAELRRNRIHSHQRSEDAKLREAVRRDYINLENAMKDLTKKERKLKASLIGDNSGKPLELPTHHQQNLEKRKIEIEKNCQKILNSYPTKERDIERVITIPQNHSCNNPQAPTWMQQSTSNDSDQIITLNSKLNDYTDKEIAEMLLKIETMKKNLLEHYGTNLPDEIFNISMASLFQNSHSKTMSSGSVVKNSSSEIQVINMSNNEQCRKPSNTVKFTNKKPAQKVSKKTLSKSTHLHTQNKTNDKEVQVELSTENILIAKDKSEIPLEPAVTIINQQDNCYSTSSESSNNNDLVIDLEDHDTEIQISKPKVSENIAAKPKTPVKILIKKCQTGLDYEKGKDIASVPSRRSQSLPDDKVDAINREESKSEPSSKHNSPKKISSAQRAKSFEKLTSQPMQKSCQTQAIQVSIDTNSSNESHSSSILEIAKYLDQIYRLSQQNGYPKRMDKKMKDSSDASTTYASPPPPQAGCIIKTMNDSTPILDILDPSITESYMRKKNELSPVSSVETPSPRTIKIPSNRPKNSRVLKFSQSQKHKEKSAKHSRDTDQVKNIGREECHCSNPFCKLLHTGQEKDIEHILERIAHYEHSLNRIRNEAKVLEEHQESVSKDTPPKSTKKNELTKNIKLLEEMLIQTLDEVTNIIGQKEIEMPRKLKSYDEVEKSPTFSEISIGTDDTISKVEIIPNGQISNKPRIINVEHVRIPREYFRLKTNIQNISNHIEKPIFESTQNEEEIQKLSQELLEQSKSLNNKSLLDNAIISDNSFLKPRPDQMKDRNNIVNMDSNNSEQKKTNEAESSFVPILAGIPKIACNSSNSAYFRKRPPVTMTSGIFGRLDSGFPGHELSTINELDTPDTGMKSMISSKNKTGRKFETDDSNRNLLSATQNQSLDLTKLAESDSLESMHTLLDACPDQLDSINNFLQNKENIDKLEISDFHTLLEENVNSKSIDGIQNSQSIRKQNSFHLTSTSSTSFSELSGISKMSTTPSSDKTLESNPTHSDIMEKTLKKYRGLRWAILELKKTREASKLSSSSNSEIKTKTKRQIRRSDDTNNRCPYEISDVSSISVKYENKSTDKSVLNRRRTSTPKRLSKKNFESSSPRTSTSELNASRISLNSSASMSLYNKQNSQKNDGFTCIKSDN